MLPRKFFLRPPDEVARDLLGKVLARRLDGELLSGRIVETEAYFGHGDAAAHSAVGKTARNAVLFGPPGFAYVYFIYGMHTCVNVSCEPDGVAGCTLLRALEPLTGQAKMAELRGLDAKAKPRLITSGPGRICQALAITRNEHNGVDLTREDSPLCILDDGFRPESVIATPRVGVHKAAERPLRFMIEGSKFVSR